MTSDIEDTIDINEGNTITPSETVKGAVTDDIKTVIVAATDKPEQPTKKPLVAYKYKKYRNRKGKVYTRAVLAKMTEEKYSARPRKGIEYDIHYINSREDALAGDTTVIKYVEKNKIEGNKCTSDSISKYIIGNECVGQDYISDDGQIILGSGLFSKLKNLRKKFNKKWLLNKLKTHPKIKGIADKILSDAHDKVKQFIDKTLDVEPEVVEGALIRLPFSGGLVPTPFL